MAEAMRFATKLSIGGTAVEFVSCDVSGGYELLLDDEGVRGTRSMTLERATQGLFKGGGTIKLQPTPAEFALIWPFVVNSSTGDTLTDTLQDVAVIVDTQTKANTFSGRFSKAKLSGRPGKRMELELTYVAYSVSVGSGGVVAATPDITVRPYMMTDGGSLTIGGVSVSYDEISLEVDNKIVPTYMQGQAPTDLMPTGREVTLDCRLKYTSTEAPLLATALAGPALGSPATGSLAFTNGANSASFAFPAMIAQPKTVVVGTDPKIRLPLSYKCLRVGASLEVVTTLA